MRKFWIGVFILVLFLLTTGCDLSTPEPTPDSGAIATSVAETLAASQPPTQPPAEPTVEPTAEPTAAPTVDHYTIFAPAPLGPAYTGLIFDYNACYDFDSYQPVDAADPECDFQMDQFGTLSPQNGALINGSNVSFDPPSKGECIDSNLLPDLLATQTDLYLCFQTTQGSYGFFVGRDLQMDLDRLIFDLYIFP